MAKLKTISAPVGTSGGVGPCGGLSAAQRRAVEARV